MIQLIELAKKSFVPNKKKYSVFSFIVKQKKVICVGKNYPLKTHSRAAKFNDEYPFLHSEMHSVLQLKRRSNIDFADCVLYNVRVGKSGRILMSRPCQSCQKLLAACGFKRIYYTNEWGRFEQFLC